VYVLLPDHNILKLAAATLCVFVWVFFSVLLLRSSLVSSKPKEIEGAKFPFLFKISILNKKVNLAPQILSGFITHKLVLKAAADC
jgi:hypothetical protein